MFELFNFYLDRLEYYVSQMGMLEWCLFAFFVVGLAMACGMPYVPPVEVAP